MIVSLERLQNFVEALKEECPEIIKWTKVAHTLSNICGIVMVGPDNAWSIELGCHISILGR